MKDYAYFFTLVCYLLFSGLEAQRDYRFMASPTSVGQKIVYTSATENAALKTEEELDSLQSTLSFLTIGELGIKMFTGVAGDTSCRGETIEDACLLGNIGLSFDLFSTIGTASSFQLVLKEVNCESGTILESIYDSGEVFMDGFNTLQNVNMNSFIINGEDGYFANEANVTDYKCYLLEATLNNEFESGTVMAYFQIDPTLPFPIENYSSVYSADSHNHSISIFPNPASNEITLGKLGDMNKSRQLHLYDQYGRRLAIYTIEAGQRNLNLNVSSLESGNYLLYDGEMKRTYRFVKL